MTLTIPPEVFQLVLDYLDQTHTCSLLDYTSLYCALACSDTVRDILLSRTILINLTKYQECPFTGKIRSNTCRYLNMLWSPHSRQIPPIISGGRKLIFFVDDTTSTMDVDLFLQNNDDAIQSSLSFDILYYGPAAITKEELSTNSVGAIHFLLHLLLTKFSQKYLKRFSGNLILEFSNSDNNLIYAGDSLFGLFSPQLIQFYMHKNGRAVLDAVKHIVLPSVLELQLHYMTLDNFIGTVLTIFSAASELFGIQNNFNPDTNSSWLDTKSIIASDEHIRATPSFIINHFLTNMKIVAPCIETVSFVKKIALSTTEMSYKEHINFIDLSTLTIKKLEESKINLKQVLQLHSLSNWTLPKIRYHSGHKFKFDENGAMPMYQAPNSITSNLQALHDCIKEQTMDATTYLRINLIPDGVVRTRLLNWAPPLEFVSSSYTRKPPLFCFRSNSLRHLELKPFFIDKNFKENIIIQGLYLPNLSTLTFTDDVALKGNIAESTLYNSSTKKSEVNPDSVYPIRAVAFLSWNQLPNCHEINFKLADQHSLLSRYVFDIENVRKSVPNIDFSTSFENYIDEKQRYVVV